MKNKVFAVVAAFIIAIPILTFTAFGATPRWTLFNSATTFCVEEDDLYGARVSAGNDVTRLDLDIILYEKGMFSSYTEVSRISRTIYDYYAVVSGSYSYSSLKNYKVELTATARTSSGQYETITVSEEY